MIIQAKKRYGQNFLKDESVVLKIIESIPNNIQQVIEIGPGLGDLTKEILVSKNVIAYEVDKDLIPVLNNRFQNEIKSRKLKLINNDVLEYWNTNNSLCEQEFNLVANLPYYISTTIILKALRDKNCKNILVMTQKEVALKFCAKPDQKEFSALSILTSSVAKAKLLFDVPNIAFNPVPKVKSSVFIIEKNKDFIITDEFEDFLRVCFKQPRKTLVKNLSFKFAKDILIKIFEELDIKINFRPHQLETFNYHLLFNNLIRK